MNVVSITPARGGSKGVPRKNIQDVCGKPLLAWTVEAALEAKLVDRVFVNSEDDEIRSAGLNCGAEVFSRPEEFYHDNTFQEVDRLLMWCVEELEKTGPKIDVVVLLYATSPLRRTKHIDEAVSLITNEGYDSSLTLVEDAKYLWEVGKDGIAKPTNYDPKTRGPRQKEAWNQWIENKAVYAMKRDLLMDTGCRLGGKIGYVEMDAEDTVDVDNPNDLEFVRYVMEQRLQNAE